MKVLINYRLHWSETNDPSITDDELTLQSEESQYYQYICDMFGVNVLIDYTESHRSVSVYPQKLTLGEIGMNEVFSEFLVPVFGSFTFKYAELGGRGCEMALILLEQELT